MWITFYKHVNKKQKMWIKKDTLRLYKDILRVIQLSTMSITIIKSCPH